MAKVKMCEYCKSNKNREVYFSTLDDDVYMCPKCKHELIDTAMEEEDHWVLCDISDDITFLEAMIDLKQNNLIEYQLKMSQFRNQVEQKKQQESSGTQLRCPKCSSTSIQIVPRKWSILTGILTNKVDRICVNCKHKF